MISVIALGLAPLSAARSPEQVKSVVLETNGKLTVIR